MAKAIGRGKRVGCALGAGLCVATTFACHRVPRPTPNPVAEQVVAGLAKTSATTSPESAGPREFPVNETINPCTDYYAYVCSATIKQFHLRDDRSDHTFSFDDLNEQLLGEKTKYLTALINATPTDPRAQMLRNIYVACMNEPAAAAEERAIVQEITTHVRALPTREAWLAFLGERILSPDLSAIAFATTPNLHNPDQLDLSLASDWMTLPDASYYHDPKILTELTKLYTMFFTTIGADRPEIRAARVVALEAAFAAHTLTPAEQRQSENVEHRITPQQIRARYPNVRMDPLLAAIPATTIIQNHAAKTLAHVNTVLGNAPLQDVEDWYLAIALHYYMDDAYPEYFTAWFDFERDFLGGPKTRPARSERCTQFVMETFGKEFDAALTPVLFPKFDEAPVRALVDRIRSALLAQIAANTWLSPPARDAALTKLRTARLQIATPHTDAEWDFLPSAEYHDNTPYANDRMAAQMSINKEIADLHAPVNHDRWEIGPLTVNAYYDPSHNKFVLPIGILRAPFYDPHTSDAQNLGGIGAIVGHELGHSIDDQGARYDETGKLHDWMTPRDHTEFSQRTAKLKTQFTRAGFNGDLTLGENIGDLVGVTTAWRALNTPTPAEQNIARPFFQQWARVWCETVRPEFAVLMQKTNPHVSGQARANEQMKLQPAFTRAYACPAGSAMTLPDADRVTLW